MPLWLNSSTAMPRYNDDYRISRGAHEELTLSRREGNEVFVDRRCSTIVDLELDILTRHDKIWITRIRGENWMKRETVKMMATWAMALALALSTARNAQAQDAKNPYPSMAPIEKYLMDRDAEIALARSAAPGIHFPRCHGCDPRERWLPNGGRRHERLYLHCRARLDEFIQQPRVLEP